MLTNALELVRVVNHYDALPIRSIMRRFELSENSYTVASSRLAHLAKDEKILEQKKIPHPTNINSRPMLVYVVGPRGREILREHGDEVKRQKFERGTAISEHNWHSLHVNDIFISTYLWTKKTPGVELRGLMTDFDMKRDKRFPYKVIDPDTGRTDRTEMDGLLGIKRAVELGKDKQFLIEYESGSHEPAALRRKIRNLVLFTMHYEKVFGTRLFSGYLFFAAATYGLKQGNPRYENPDEHRKVILREISIVLGEMDAEELISKFRVTASPVDSTDFLTRPVWWFPNHFEPFHLFSDLG